MILDVITDKLQGPIHLNEQIGETANLETVLAKFNEPMDKLCD